MPAASSKEAAAPSGPRSLVRSSTSSMEDYEYEQQQQHRSLGLPISMSCFDPTYPPQDSDNANSNASNIRPMFNVTVLFSYELAVYNPNEMLSEITVKELPQLEYSVLYMVAQAINLRPCSLESQQLPHDAAVTSLSSVSPDTVDDSVRELLQAAVSYFSICVCMCVCFILQHVEAMLSFVEKHRSMGDG